MDQPSQSIPIRKLTKGEEEEKGGNERFWG